MAISLVKQPGTLHTSINTNWWAFQSNLRFAPRFSLRASIKDGSVIYNTLLLPTTPSNYNILDIKNVISDYVSPDFNVFITNPTASVSYRNYRIDVQETFEGLYIFGTSSAGSVGTVSVVNNSFLMGFATPSLVSEIDFVGGSVTSPITWAIGYGTASNGFVNRINLSSSETSFIPVTASIGNNSPGYMILSDFNIYSDGATYSTDVKSALIGNIDYLDYNELDNFSGYGSGLNFLTNSPRELTIQGNEVSTLSFIMSSTSSINHALYTLDTGATFSKSVVGLSQSLKIDIPTGPANLSLASTVKSYSVNLVGSGGSGETFYYNVECISSFSDSVRLAWLNRLGGIDYYTFRFTEQSGVKVSRNNFDKNIKYGAVKSDRGITTYKLDYYNEYSVVSDLLDDETSEWLSELYTSTDVYWIYNNELIPITISGDAYNWSTGFDSREARFSYRLSRTNYK